MKSFLSIVVDAVRFNILPTDNLHKKLYQLKTVKEYGPYDHNQDELGYHSSNFIYITDSNLLILEVTLILMILHFILKPIKHTFA